MYMLGFSVIMLVNRCLLFRFVVCSMVLLLLDRLVVMIFVFCVVNGVCVGNV